MKKLIELLNEYEKEQWRNFEVKEIWMSYRNNDLLVISKRYWFIKWLVDNDKIDLNNSELSNFRNVYYGYENDKDTPYKTVLMLLSIQDNPIEFLVSILK